MKRIIALFLAVLMLGSFFTVTSSAFEVSRCVTWVYKPERLGLNKNYVAVYYKTGEQLVYPEIPGDGEPKYETETTYYVFAGWKVFESVDEIRNYYNNKPGIGYFDPYTEAPLPVMGKSDINLGAVYRLLPKRYDLTGDRAATINDVTELLNYLSKEASDDSAYDVNQDTDVNIKDVTELLNFLAQ